MNSFPAEDATFVDEQRRVADMIARIQAKRGDFADEGACWVTFSNDVEKCYRGLDPEGCADLQDLARVKTHY